MENYFEILKKCRMFTGLDIDDIKHLTEILNSKVIKYSKGDVIFSEGEKPKHIGAVLHGNAQIERTDYYGNRSIVAVLEPSEVFGEAFVCAGIKSVPVDVVALDETVVMLFGLPDIPPENTDLYNRFMDLLQKDFRRHRTIKYYAEALNVSPKYFASLIKKVSGKTAGEWIDEYVMLEARALLKSRRYTIQQISDMLSFPNQSFFAKYFKAHIGCTPTHYQTSDD